MSSVSIEKPRSTNSPARRSAFKVEKWGWIYMRASGVVLVVLIFGHLFVNLLASEGGVKAIDFAFVGGKWSDPFWKIWDGALLWLALIHGANGMRTIVNDYASNALLNRIFKVALLVSTIVLLTLGSLVILTFDPCPIVSADKLDLLPSFCPAQ